MIAPEAPRRVVITGATGIAAAVAHRLADDGRQVFIVSIHPDHCEDLASALGPACSGHVVADLRDEAQAVDAFDAAVQAMGHIDGLIATAGGSARRSGDGWLHEIPLSGWQAAIATNLTTTFLATREAVRRMRRTGGSIVLTSSVLATSPQPEHFATHAYAATKAAISGWVVPLAAAYAADGIRINCVAPGLVDTPGAQRAARSDVISDFVRRKQPLTDGILDADAIAEAMIWVLDAHAMSGQVVRIDGGWSIISTS